jgi:hypothetical protein
VLLDTDDIIGTVNTVSIFYSYLFDFLPIFSNIFTIFHGLMWILIYKHNPPNIMATVNTMPVVYTFFSNFLATFLKFFTIFYD